ncbi:unnamed protein product, partial [Medioppia subpectinata]
MIIGRQLSNTETDIPHTDIHRSNFSIMNGQLHDKSVYYREGSSKGGSIIGGVHPREVHPREVALNQRNHCTDYNAMHRITGGLHLGGYLAATVESALREGNIGTILTVMDTPIPTEHRFPGIAYHWIPAYDDEYQNLLSHFPLAYDIIENGLAASPDAGVYVHCAAGISRSATTVISYIMRNMRMPYETARALVGSRRGVINPNP